MDPSAEAVARVLPLRIRPGRYGLQPQISTIIADTCLRVPLWDTLVYQIQVPGLLFIFGVLSWP